MIQQLVEQIEARRNELEQALGDPTVISDRNRFAEVSREYSSLELAGKLATEWKRVSDDEAGARELLDEGGDDAEVREMLQTAKQRREELDEEIRLAMVEADPNDERDVIVEIRGGAGGDEAGLFAGDLFRMLTRAAERLGFKPQVLQADDGNYTFEIKGKGAYSIFKYEGGTHRVQRVPQTESQGRIHTSSATVTVRGSANGIVIITAVVVDVYGQQSTISAPVRLGRLA